MSQRHLANPIPTTKEITSNFNFDVRPMFHVPDVLRLDGDRIFNLSVFLKEYLPPIASIPIDSRKESSV